MLRECLILKDIIIDVKKTIKLFNKYNVKIYILIIFFSISTILLRAFIPFIYGSIINKISQFQEKGFWEFLVIYLLFITLILFFSNIEQYLKFYYTTDVCKKIKNDIFNHILYAKIAELKGLTSSDCISRLEMDIDQIVSFVVQLGCTLIFIIINFLISVIYILHLNLTLSILCFFFLPSTSLVFLFFKSKIKKNAEFSRIIIDKYYGIINEAIENLCSIKCFQLENIISLKFNKIMDSRFNNLIEKQKIYMYLGVINDCLSNSFTILIIIIAARLIFIHRLTLGDLISFNMYVSMLYQSIKQFQGIKSEYQIFSISINRIEALYAMSKEGTDKLIKELPISDIKEINIKNVYFKYFSKREIQKYILNNISCTFVKGFNSIVGRNGCGKTTLARILLGLYTIDKGDIYINKNNYNFMNIKTIRNEITYISKDCFILNDTIYNNISIINNNLKESDIENICKIVQLHEQINELPNQYNTILGQKGVDFSSGMKQKLNFARAIARNRKIIILDEVTSDLDGESELKIVEIIKRMSKTHIIISITHKFATVVKSDKIFVMDKGTIIDEGTYTYLIKNNSIFQELFKDN